MNFQLYSQLYKLDRSNDQLIQMYNVLYYDLPSEDSDMVENICKLIELREKLKLELKSHLFDVKNCISKPAVSNKSLDFLPLFLKLEFLSRNTFKESNLKGCYQLERKNIKLFYETLYNQDISSATLEALLYQRKKIETIPK